MERIDQEGHQLPRKGQNILSASPPPPFPFNTHAPYEAPLENRGGRGTDANEHMARRVEKRKKNTVTR